MTLDIEKKAFNRQEASLYLGVALNTFVRLMKSGKIRYVRAGYRYLIPRDALDEFLAGGNEKVEAVEII